MHHAESAGDSPGSRKMAHTSVFASRRGSNTGSGGVSVTTNAANMNCNAVPGEDHQSSLIMHHTPPTGSSSPGPLHPPLSLNMHAQPQSLQSAGAQVKKKSGFQITSVLPAQVSASANNSIADDTESYDDMDESHTEDLSSSDILDVSVSRATDTGIPERSSSEETLNSLHGGETPGVTSPNEPVMQHAQSTQQGYMVNGTVHHHGHHHHSHQPHGHHKDQGIPPVTTQPVQGAASAAPATAVPVPSAAAMPGRTQRAPSLRGSVDVGTPGIMNQPLSTCGAGGAGTGGGVVGTTAVGTSLPGTAGPTGTTMTATPVTPVQPAPPSGSAASTATASRFRVVKLDSSSEPFRKGRWVCAEYYEKEGVTAAPPADAAPPHRAVESVVQSESESTSASSSGSLMSGDQVPQQAFVPTAAHHHALPQDPGAHTVAPPTVGPINPQIVPVPGLLGTEGQPAAVRVQQQVPYTLEAQAGQGQGGYTITQQPSVSVNQGLQSVDYAPIPQGMQATAQPHQMPPAPRLTPVPTQMPSLPLGPPVAAPQAVSPRPQASAPQMVLGQGSALSQAPLHAQQKPTEQQQGAVGPPPPPSSAAPSVPSSTLQNSLQPGLLPQTLQQGGAVSAHSGGLGLALRHQGGQSSQPPPAGGPYGGMASLTASQLEDAGRLLFQHQSLLSLPRLGAGGVAGLIGRGASEAGSALTQEGSASGDAGALAATAGTDDDSSSGASVVAIDNKIEQAMDLVKSHLMYAVREEVEVLKEQIKELMERNSQLEQENSLLKNLASPEQLAQFQAQVQTSSPTSGTQPGALGAPAPLQNLPPNQGPPV
ncbi:TSC22 domain family protein 1 [Brachyhypopomus gauderio]|uniref:TSC22 domain family protein 1 n=1 Tax=Brachyhypopomus gauderio TaxID=698409 RepID=UPI004041D5A6